MTNSPAVTPDSDTSIAVRQLKGRSYLVIGCGLVLLGLASGLGFFALYQHEKTQVDWSHQNQQVVQLNETLAEFNGAIGYGGFIHNFKNLVLRRDIETYGPLIEKNLVESEELLNRLDSLSASQDFGELHGMLNTFQERYAVARTMIHAGQDIAAIDLAVRYSNTDVEALAAIKHLSQTIRRHTQAIESAAEQKNQKSEKLLYVSGALLIASVILAIVTLLIYLKRIIGGYQANVQHQLKIKQQGLDLARTFNELRATEERYTLALDGNGDGVWDWDIAANKVFLSRRWKTMLGHEEHEIGTDLSEWSSRLNPLDVDRVMADVQANLGGKTESFANEHRVRCKDGSYLWVLDRGKVVQRDADGKPLRMVGTHTYITAQKIVTRSLEGALRDSSALLHALNMHAIISVADKAGNIIEVNDAFCNISGYSREELLGKNHRIVNSNVQPRQFWVDMWCDIANGKPWRSQVCNRAKNGTHYWVDTFIAPFMNADGTIEKYISIRTDITSAKQQEVKLQSARDQLEKAAEVAEMGIWIWNLETNILDWNERMHNIYESPSEIRESGAYYDYWRSRVHPEDIGFTESQLDLAIKGKGTYNPTFRIINTKGKSLYIQAAAIVECNEAGKPVRVMGINRDITQQYETETILRKAKQSADDASKAKSEFLANMSHELRTPMNAILGMLTLLKKTDLNIRQADYAKKTEGAAKSLLGLLNDILDLSKAESGKMALDPIAFSMDNMLRDLSVILSSSAAGKQIEVLFDVAADVPRELVGDTMRLQQVLLNLSSNAIKFTEQGEVVLKIEKLQKDDKSVTLKFSVKDTGIGIALENQARIFSGFTQAEASTTRRFGGTGLGLAISQYLVGLMGGKLALVSAIGKGSCFYFSLTLPLSEHNQPHIPANENVMGWSVLVVDDNPTALNIIAQQCESLGWQVDCVAGGEQALALIKQQAERGREYRVVFVDWKMPEMDGWQTSLAIRQLELENVPSVVVMVTTHDREKFIERSKAEQALINGFLVKPVTTTMLLDAVMEASGATKETLNTTTLPGAHEPRLMGLKILLTEDNLNNQQVACELLESEGAIVEIANNGQEAVERLAKTPVVDIVLMDLQMPVMDGLAATKNIRNNLGLVDLPIIAMTANAMQSDKDNCREAGMNDHIGKPFDLNDLVNVLRQQVGWESLQAPTASVSQIDNAYYQEAAIMAKVDIATALKRLGGKEDLYVRMLSMFLGNLKDLPEKLNRCVESKDFLQASKELHTLKGLAGTMGIMELATQAGLAEKLMAGEITASSARLQILNINALISEVLPKLVKFLTAMQSSLQPQVQLDKNKIITDVDKAALIEKLEQLIMQLNNSDMTAADTTDLITERFGFALGNQLDNLNQAMMNLDFVQARQCAIVLIKSIDKNIEMVNV